MQPPPAMPAPAARPKWLWPAIAAAAASSVLAIALVVSRHHSVAVAAPAPPPVAAAPVAAAPVAVAKPATPAPALLVVDTDVPSARITLDGRVVADNVPRARIKVPRPGAHELTVTAARRKPFTRSVDLDAGATVELEVKLERRRAKPARGENYLVNPFRR